MAINPTTQWWLTKTSAGRRTFAKMVPARVFEQMTGQKHPSTLIRERDEKLRRERLERERLAREKYQRERS